MGEAQAIIEAFDEAQARGDASALATVVSVEGSAYWRPAARMLVTKGGASTGTISAGCLESDVIEHAKQVIKTNVAKLLDNIFVERLWRSVKYEEVYLKD